jgi:hypothetical protein
VFFFSADNSVLDVAQAACVALPAAGLPAWLLRFRAGRWALVAPLSIGVVIGGIALIPSVADLLTWIALILVPFGCAVALGWAAHGAGPRLAVSVIPLLAVAWAFRDTHMGQLAAVVLIAGSAIAAGRLIAGAAPLDLLKLGVVAMAVIDAILVFSNQLQGPNAKLELASPALGLPQLQSAAFGQAGLGYGDLFAAAVVGGIVAAEDGPQLYAAVATYAATLAWEQLFAYFDELPATVPPAVVLIGFEIVRRRRLRGRAEHPIRA